MPVYLLGAIDRKDLTTYARYEAKGFESVERYGAEGLAVCDTPEVIEGVLPGKRIVLLKFENRVRSMSGTNRRSTRLRCPCVMLRLTPSSSLYSMDSIDSTEAAGRRSYHRCEGQCDRNAPL